MCRFGVRWMAGIAAVAGATVAVRAQAPMPRIGYVYPAGGRQGTKFSVTVGGQNLQGAAGARISGEGVEARVLEYQKPMTPQQFNALREKLKELVDSKKNDSETLQEIAKIRKAIAGFVRRPTSPAIAETVTLEMVVEPDAAPGERELRLTLPAGVTNPLAFHIGQLPEFREEEPKEPNEPRRPNQPGINAPSPHKRSEPETTVTLPAVVNGQIMPGDADRFRFKARTGQRLVVAASARALIPYLPDAVPGWFQATLALYDAQGKELAYDDDYRFHPDPVLLYRIPADGEYVVEIRDAIYRGREDFVYRVTLGDVPFITSIFPLGGRAGEPTTVEVRGWNLPLTTLVQDGRGRGPGPFPLVARKGKLLSNAVPFVLDTLPECLEKEPNNAPDAAQPVALPIIVNGRVDAPGDVDIFRLDGRAGAEVVAEVRARRLDSPLDSVVKLTDAAGKPLATNDDQEDRAAGLTTHHADSVLRVKLPADGAYFVHLGDAQRKGGPEYAYRVRISPPRPDFELRAAPSSITLRGGSTGVLTVYALRQDGFSGEIGLALRAAPAGCSLAGGRVPAGQDQVRVTLTAPPRRMEGAVPVVLEGRAMINGREVVRSVVPAEDMMQAFAYRHLVPCRELLLTTVGGWGPRQTPRILSDTPIRIPAGGTARVQVGMPAQVNGRNVRLELSEPPDGITIRGVSTERGGTDILLSADKVKARPGLQGNLIVTVTLEKEGGTGKGNAPQARPRTPVGLLPAVPFEIVASH